MPKKSIIIFSTAYLPFVGGAEVAIKEITDRLNNAEFFLITARMKRVLPKKEKVGNIMVYRLGFGFSFDKFLLPILGFFKFFRLNSKFKIQNSKFIIWGMMASYGSIAAYFIKLFKPQIPFLLTLQEGDSERHLKWGKFGLVGLFGKLIIRKADYIQTISGYLKDFAIKRDARAPIEVVPNGADLQKLKSQISNLKTTAQNLKIKLNIKPEEKVIITVSRLVHKNAVDIAIEAFYLLNSKFLSSQVSFGNLGGQEIQNSKFLIIGDGPEKENLKLKIRNLKLQNQVILYGSVPPDEVYKYLAIADVFVRPSRSEGLGNAFLEAMASGVPIIGTPVGGIPDFLIDGETGLFCKVDDPNDLAEKIKILFENDELRNRVIKNGKILVEEKYNWSNISQKMEKIFADLIKNE